MFFQKCILVGPGTFHKSLVRVNAVKEPNNGETSKLSRDLLTIALQQPLDDGNSCSLSSINGDSATVRVKEVINQTIILL